MDWVDYIFKNQQMIHPPVSLASLAFHENISCPLKEKTNLTKKNDYKS